MANNVPLVTVIIPSWNGRHLLGPCLQSVMRQTLDDYRVILVDNGSTDGTAAWVREHFPQIRILEFPEPLGFARSVNEGIRASESRYVVVLNNDTEVDPAWLAALVQAAESDTTVGMCASKMRFADRPDMINSAGICIDRVGIAWDCRGGEPDRESESEPVEIFGPCGGAALYRSEMLRQIGLFDEDFFLYMEDVDLAWRARIAGWRCLYVPAARVLHCHSATSQEGSPFKSFHLGRNKVWLLLKNYPVQVLWYYVPLVVLYDLAAVVYALLARRDIHALRGRLAGLAGGQRMWRKRPRDTAKRTDIRFLVPPVWPWQVPGRYRHIRTS